MRFCWRLGCAPERLELEITEGVLIDDPTRACGGPERLKALGVKIAMDDFGKGYASLSSLQSFPFDKIKIDRAFVRVSIPVNPLRPSCARSSAWATPSECR